MSGAPTDVENLETLAGVCRAKARGARDEQLRYAWERLGAAAERVRHHLDKRGLAASLAAEGEEG